MQPIDNDHGYSEIVYCFHVFTFLMKIVLFCFVFTSGHTSYTCMLNNKGMTEADLTVSVLEPGSGAPHAPKFEGIF